MQHCWSLLSEEAFKNPRCLKLNVEKWLRSGAHLGTRKQNVLPPSFPSQRPRLHLLKWGCSWNVLWIMKLQAVLLPLKATRSGAVEFAGWCMETLHLLTAGILDKSHGAQWIVVCRWCAIYLAGLNVHTKYFLQFGYESQKGIYGHTVECVLSCSMCMWVDGVPWHHDFILSCEHAHWTVKTVTDSDIPFKTGLTVKDYHTQPLWALVTTDNIHQRLRFLPQPQI